MAGVRFMYLSWDDEVVRARKGRRGLHVVKTVQAVIISVYFEPIVPEQCAYTTENLCDYFEGSMDASCRCAAARALVKGTGANILRGVAGFDKFQVMYIAWRTAAAALEVLGVQADFVTV